MKPAIILDTEGAEDLETTEYLYTEADKPFSSLMSDIKVLTQCMLAHIKTQVENPQIAGSVFTPDQIMHLHVNFHKLASIQGSSYIT